VLALEVKTRMYLQRKADYKKVDYQCEHSTYHFAGLERAVAALQRLPKSDHEQLHSVCELLLYGLCLATHSENFGTKRLHIGVLIPFYINKRKELPVIRDCLRDVRNDMQPVFRDAGLSVPEFAAFMLIAEVSPRTYIPSKMSIQKVWGTKGFRISTPRISEEAISEATKKWMMQRYIHHGCTDCKHVVGCIAASDKG